VRTDAPTCRLDETVRWVRERLRGTEWDTCVVVNEERVVLGRLGRRALASDGDGTVEDAITEGPSTIRPSARLEAIAERMEKQRLTSVIVSTSDGRLVGVLRREDLT